MFAHTTIKPVKSARSRRCRWTEAVVAHSANAVDALTYRLLSAALTHGTLPWTVEGRTRTTLFYKFNTNGSSWTRNYFDPAEFAEYEVGVACVL